MTEEYYKRYRPVEWDQVYGQPQAVSVLKKMVERKSIPHVLLLVGASGTGKTTCARILKEEMKCHDRDFIEKDFGEAGGVAAARAIIERLSSAPVGKCRIYYLDEVHRASNDAQTALLKTFEDTPKHVYFILSTTHPQKLLKTIKTRATEIVFNEMSEGAILQAVDDVVKAEKIKLGGDVQAALINAAQGSARKALVLLDQIANLPANEQLKAIHGADSEVQAIDICRALLGKGTRWSDMAKLLKGISNDQAENLRWAILGYARNALLNGANPKAHQIIYEFSNNFFNTGSAGLVWACYAIIQGK